MKRTALATISPLGAAAALLVLGALTTPARSQQPGEQLTTTGRVKLRADSNYDSPVRGVLPEGTSLTALAPHSDATGYTRVKAAVDEGWVAGESFGSRPTRPWRCWRLAPRPVGRPAGWSDGG